MSDYLGATEGELLSVSAGRRFLGYHDQQALFPHHGQLRLEPEELVLGGWLASQLPAAVPAGELRGGRAFRRGGS